MAKKKDVEAPAEEAAPPAAKITQREAVRQALAAGAESPSDGVPFIKEKFDITLTNQAFSTLKSQLKKAAAGGKTGKKPGRPAASTNSAAPSQAVGDYAKGGFALHIEAIKTLVETLGVDEVVSIARLFGK